MHDTDRARPRVRPAGPDDAPRLAALLNSVVDEGDKTAIDHHLTPEEARDWFVDGPACRGCVLAEDGSELLGFQAVEVFQDDLPEGWADIATFVADGARGRGVGRALLTGTLAACPAHGIRTLRAVVRATNAGAQAFYRASGFEPVVDAVRGPSVVLARPVDAPTVG